MTSATDVVDALAGMALFADLSSPQLHQIAHSFEEESFVEGQRILRRGLSGGGFYVIIEGEAAVELDGRQIATLARGDFFGEVSILLDEPPSADIVAMRAMRCIVLPGHALDDFLRSLPSVAIRMLQAEARRLRTSNQWLS